MRRVMAALACCVLLAERTYGDEVIFPDGTAARNQGGLMIIRQGGQTTLSLGGVLFRRRVLVSTDTPAGPVLTRFRLPSMLHSPTAPPLPESAPAVLEVTIPDDYGLLYIDGELVRTRGPVRHLESPLLPPGLAYPVRVRAAFKRGDHLLIEDKVILLQAGQGAAVTFDGSAAVAVPLPPVLSPSRKQAGDSDNEMDSGAPGSSRAYGCAWQEPARKTSTDRALAARPPHRRRSACRAIARFHR